MAQRATGLFLGRSPAIVLEAIKSELAARRVLAAKAPWNVASDLVKPFAHFGQLTEFELNWYRS